MKTKFLHKKDYPHISLIIGIPFLLRLTFFGVCHLFTYSSLFKGQLVRLKGYHSAFMASHKLELSKEQMNKGTKSAALLNSEKVYMNSD